MPLSSGSLQKKLKTALNETRLLVLGGQILLGFQFQGVFQESFGELSSLARGLDAVALLLMVTTLGLLIAPSMQHRIVEQGRTTERIFRVTGTMAGAALLPFAISLGIDHYAVFERLFGPAAGYMAGAAFFILALVFWYGLEYLVKRATEAPMSKSEPEQHTPLSTKIEEMLTEARVVLPGAQALLGFQLVVTLTRAFETLPFTSRLVHAAALVLVALAVILLMAPAAFHRIAFRGEDTEDFHRIGSWFVVAATVPLAAGIAGDVYVAVGKIAETQVLGIAAALVVLIVLIALWYAQPYLLRRKLAAQHAARRG
ncbi:MAG: hypothetical protein E6G88_07220 [Alphaproteobacteria bacterium]|nr:MAG: hypothetical protein E6G88_07220 [Alphaproteobacteria bacterium]